MTKIDKTIKGLDVPIRKIKKQTLIDAISLLERMKKLEVSKSDLETQVADLNTKIANSIQAGNGIPEATTKPLEIDDGIIDTDEIDDVTYESGDANSNQDFERPILESYVCVLDEKTNAHYVYENARNTYRIDDAFAVLDKSSNYEFPDKFGCHGQLDRIPTRDGLVVGLKAKIKGSNSQGVRIRKIKGDKIFFVGTYGTGHSISKMEIVTKILIPDLNTVVDLTEAEV